MKKLILIPPITTYDFVGQSLDEYPAPVVRDRIRVLSEFYSEVHVIAGSRTSSEKSFVEDNIHFHILSSGGKLGFLKKYFGKYRSLLNQCGGCSVLNLNPLWVGAILNVMTGSKNNFVTQFISFPLQWSFPQYLARAFYSFNLKRSSRVIAVTPMLKNHLLNLSSVSISVVTNRVKKGIKVALDPVPNSVFYAARLSPEKRQDFLLDVFSKVHEVKKGLKLFLAGDGDQTFYREKARSLGVSDHVEFLGGIPREKVYEYLSKSTVFAIPSVHEGFGLVYLEAMACGIPIVATDSGSTRWVVEDAAILVEKDDVVGFANAVMKLLGDEGMRDELIAKGYSRVEKFSYDSWGKDLFEAIEG